jgi:hypothetical protein
MFKFKASNRISNELPGAKKSPLIKAGLSLFMKIGIEEAAYYVAKEKSFPIHKENIRHSTNEYLFPCQVLVFFYCRRPHCPCRISKQPEP